MKKSSKLSIVGIVIFLIVATIIAINSGTNKNNSRVTKFDAEFRGEMPTPTIETNSETNSETNNETSNETNNETNSNITLTLSSDKGTVVPKPKPTLPTEIVADDTQESQTGENNMANTNLSNKEQNLVDKAKTMLTELRQNLKADDIKLVSIKSQEWSDGSLGCPEPGGMYIQMITSGYIIILEADNSLYQFNTDTRQTVKLCLIDGVDANKVK